MAATLIPANKRKATYSLIHGVAGRSLGVVAENTAQMVRQVQRGFPYAAIVRFQRESGLPLGRIADLIRIPPRTLVRRKASGRLLPEESERLLRIAGVFEQALELFEGDREAARHWLTTPSEDLDEQSPLDFAITEIGARDVENLIGRLEHGVFT